MAIGRADAPFAGTYGAGYFGDLYKTFAGMGLPTTLQGMYTGGYDPSVAWPMYRPSLGAVTGAMRRQYGTKQLGSELFSTISKPQLQGMQWSTYKPQIEQSQQNLLGSLLNTYRKGGQRAASGGMAGSSNLDAYTKGVRDVYGKGMTETLANIGQQRAEAYKGIQDTISNWHQQSQAFVAGQ
tara:strand:+ start:1503 stop:2048 length:546 start_codon:yes stop_codon:yes gene_type:complete